jgi:hypothetical protein
MNARWHDLIIDRLDDGGIHLEQHSGVDDPNVIHLHPEQLLFIARQLCGIKSETAEKVRDLERRIAVLTDKLQNIVCNGAFRSDLLEATGDGFEYLARLDSLLDLALEFDGGRLEPEEPPVAYGASNPSSRHGQSAKASKAPSRATAEGGEQLGLAV